ncbi:hypothetical protein SAY86_001434 [Trapa natans]|uniref:DDB1-and CUL4-associated factor 8 n=1 Tax=Trapa natans TaxID=22666 RepID=A0AAN7MGI9_TRANT|nr:hypothetical protein SAY86_001434 [Trapa natans]
MNKRRRTNSEKMLPNVCRRELGELSPRSFKLQQSASEDVVQRFEIYKKLEKHRGCVNTVSFNYDGDILISGSDDRRVILWDWAAGKSKLSFYSGHVSNIFHAKFMPYTDDRSIVTCAADGQVRYSQILESGEVKISLLAKHEGGAHKLAIEPGSPHVFYSCGEDGLVQHFDLRTETATELFSCRLTQERRRYTPIIHLNAIAIDPRDPNLFSVAGSDEYARLYDIRMYQSDGTPNSGQPVNYFCPSHLIGDRVGITGLAYSDNSELLASYNDESIYLFTHDMGLGPNPCQQFSKSLRKGKKGQTSSLFSGLADKPTPQVYKGHRNCETVKGVGFFGPKSEYVVSGSDCGRIFIWKKGGELIRIMEADKDIVNCIEAHPHTPVLASSGIEDDIKIWTPTAAERAVLPRRIDGVKPKPRPWSHHISTPEEVLMQLFSSLHRASGAESEHDTDSPTALPSTGLDLMELIFSYNGMEDSSDSSDAGGDGENGELSEEAGGEGDASGPEDFFN